MIEKRKIDWLAVLQGFSMLLVIMGHVSLTNLRGDPNTPIANGIERIIFTFHMPLFIFISGWLFYYTCIGRNKTYKDMLMSKLKRLAVPFFSFSIVTTMLKIAFPQLMHRAVNAEEIINTFVFLRSNPLGEMWFVIVLFELMLLYPVYKIILENWLTAIIGFLGAVFISKFCPPISYFNLGRVAFMLPFFVAGILCCRFEWHRYIGKWHFLVVMAGLFIMCNMMGLLPESMKAGTAFVGTLFSMSLCLIVGKYMPHLFSSFRDYTFQIFLMGIFFQMVIRWIYVKVGNEALFVPMWLLSVIIGVYFPTFIAICIEKYAPKYVRLCFGI